MNIFAPQAELLGQFLLAQVKVVQQILGPHAAMADYRRALQPAFNLLDHGAIHPVRSPHPCQAATGAASASTSSTTPGYLAITSSRTRAAASG